MKILTEKQAEIIYDNCIDIYDSKGIQEVINYCDKLNLHYGFCNQCESEMPMVETNTYCICAVCGTEKYKHK